MSPRRTAQATLAIAAAACWPLATASAAPLEAGDHGKRVKRLQRALSLPADGRFGSRTARAVKRFQRRHHIDPDGVVGPATWAEIRSESRAERRRSVSSGSSSGSTRVQSRGAAVKAAQRLLGIQADGVFGPGTRRAVKRFQQARGMAPDGIVGAATWSALGIRTAQPVLKRSSRARRSTATSRSLSVVAIASQAANEIATKPYRWGGGHRSFVDTAYDCSGSVSYVLHAIGRLDKPMDSGELMSYGEPGPGRFITIYAHGSHAFMTIGGRRFDTTGRGSTGSRWQSSMRATGGYTVRHPPGL